MLVRNSNKRDGVVVPDVATEFNKYLDKRDPCEVFTKCGGGHFNPEGYRVLAEIAYAAIEANSWRKK